MTCREEYDKLNEYYIIRFIERAESVGKTLCLFSFNWQNNVFGFNTGFGSVVSANCVLCVNNVYYIDAFIQLTKTVPENGTLFYVVKNDNVITFKHRLDAILINSSNGKVYQTVLLKDSNIFIANGTSIPSGFYKVTMIISI